MLEFSNIDIFILAALASCAGGLSSILFGKWIRRRTEISREGWHEKERRRIEAINKQLNGGT
jgi:membrane protein YqaA with SNARE-associated domain